MTWSEAGQIAIVVINIAVNGGCNYFWYRSGKLKGWRERETKYDGQYEKVMELLVEVSKQYQICEEHLAVLEKEKRLMDALKR